MGSDSIFFKVKGKASKDEINKAFKARQESDADENGHRQGYSGDFQTVHKIDFRLYQTDTFESLNEAQEYCLKHAEKFLTVIAVYYKNKDSQIDTLVGGWGAC
jgi:hypothetical protein